MFLDQTQTLDLDQEVQNLKVLISALFSKVKRLEKRIVELEEREPRSLQDFNILE